MKRLLGILSCCLALAGSAHAWESTPQAVVYEDSKNLFDAFGFDTDWWPADSPIQVRFALSAGSGWTASLKGKGHLGWPEPFALRMLGDPEGGLLDMSVGLELIAKLRVHLDADIITIDWEGDIPYVPNFDLRFSDRVVFDPFLPLGADPARATVKDTIPPVTLFTYDITDALIPIPGVSGGFELQVGGTVEAALHAGRFEVKDAAGTILNYIEEAEAAAKVPLTDQSHLQLTERYTALFATRGDLILVPSVYIELAGDHWDLPLGTFPVTVVDEDRPWDFGEKTTAFPLPDIGVTERKVDFGTLETGTRAWHQLKIGSYGELALIVHGTTDGPFTVSPADLTIAPGESATVTIRATAPAGGGSGVLHLASNDPDEPLVDLELVVSGTGSIEQQQSDAGYHPDAGPGADLAAGGCCRVGGRGAPGLALALLGLAALLRARRRRPPAPPKTA